MGGCRRRRRRVGGAAGQFLPAIDRRRRSREYLMGQASLGAMQQRHRHFYSLPGVPVLPRSSLSSSSLPLPSGRSAGLLPSLPAHPCDGEDDASSAMRWIRFPSPGLPPGHFTRSFLCLPALTGASTNRKTRNALPRYQKGGSVPILSIDFDCARTSDGRQKRRNAGLPAGDL